MNTIKLNVSVNPCIDWVCDVLKASLAEKGFDTFVDSDTGFEAYIPQNLFHENDLVVIKADIPETFAIRIEQEVIPAKNWNEVWEKNYFQPLVVRDEIVVRAPFHKQFRTCRYEIVIEPNMAFGTGNHETTTLMMEAMLDLDLHGKALLDMGCGTGILAILAAQMGANPITAIDIDEWAFEATIENSNRNSIANIKAFQGDATLLGNEKFDIILANIQKNIIISDMERYASVLQKNGKLLVSGFYINDKENIRAVAEGLGLEYFGSADKNLWTFMEFHKAG